ncbi:hypothetical protein E4K65_09520 [Bradyrhizobium niftali]|uniref:Uncharacterized protein n=1 Tax=Bradyrhizobium niftali TaxID=2560055 RepID=A0A4Y9M1Z3_9BRAD|nr:hypothetical protein E4K65_09520 [Bradyrhizobium niftali]
MAWRVGIAPLMTPSTPLWPGREPVYRSAALSSMEPDRPWGQQGTELGMPAGASFREGRSRRTGKPGALCLHSVMAGHCPGHPRLALRHKERGSLGQARA